MKQSQVGVHPLLSVTVMAGILGLAGYVPLATSAETTGLAGFSQASDQQIAGAAEVVGSDQAHTGVASSAATLLTKVEVKPEGERLSLVLTGNGVFAHTVKMLGDRRMVLDMPHMQSSGTSPSWLSVTPSCRGYDLAITRTKCGWCWISHSLPSTASIQLMGA